MSAFSVRGAAFSIALVAVAAAASACRDSGTIKVKSLNFKGVTAVNTGDLKNALATKTSSKFFFGKTHFFDRSQFENDLKRITAFYGDHGYPHARVTNFDVKLSPKQDAVDVTLTIDEGDPVIVKSIDYKGFDIVPERHFNTVKHDAPIKVNQPRNKQYVLTTQEMALNELRDHGYPYAKVTVDEDDGPDGLQATLTFVGEPGKIAYFGPTTVQGNESVSDRVILRQVPYKQGDLYRRSRVQDAQRRIYGLSLFSFANIEPVDIEKQPEIVPTRITVAEGNKQRVDLSLGYGTEEQVRADVEYHKLNFLGGARDAGVRARWSSLDRGLQFNFNQPYLFEPHTSLGLQAQQWYAFTPAYQTTTTGGSATATYRLRQKTDASFTFRSERDVSTINPDVSADPKLRNNLIALGLNPDTLDQRGMLNSFKIEGHHSTADNLLDARKGYQATLAFEEAGHLLPGSFRFTQVTLDGRHYFSVGSRFTLANRAQLGNISAPADDPTAVPFSRKFFLGGATSVRGWGRYELSPLSESGLPIGGNSMFEYSLEGRERIRGSFGAVLFFDTGNVWADSWQIKLNDLRRAVGAGLRYQTPVGPLRFDVGYQLNPIPGLLVNGEPQTRRWRMHFSIGQAF
ncbi:MAG TPA: BamA/TamA family outer membrane protein [Vicinamibacterales bacterium]|nr:BamA/TamA family outer membrane protein [Vicinamibacterales bacterium]